MSKFRVVLRDKNDETRQLAEGSYKPIAFFAPTKQQALRDARKHIQGKPDGCYAEVYETHEQLIFEVNANGVEPR